MRKIAALAAAICWPLLTAASCATTSGPPTNMPVAGTCVPKDLPDVPAGLETRETLAAAPDVASRYQRLYADWKLRVARMLETEPVIVACR